MWPDFGAFNACEMQRRQSGHTAVVVIAARCVAGTQPWPSASAPGWLGGCIEGKFGGQFEANV